MIYIIITTSIHNKVGVQNQNHRQNRYVESITALLKIIHGSNIKPIIVENNGHRNTFLDKFGCDVCYTDNNKTNYPHKGANELLDIKELIQQYSIQDNDTIIKLTGRYKLLNPFFLQLIKKYEEYDAFVKFFNVCTKQYMVDDCVLGLFAIKCKYLKNFNYSFLKSPECEFADYVGKMKHIKVKQLYVECCFADDLRLLIV